MRYSLDRWIMGRGISRGWPMMPMFVTLMVAAACAGLVSPVLSSRPYNPARERSMRNLRALAHATLMYMDDWEGTFPGWIEYPDDSGKYIHNVWDEQIAPHSKGNTVYNNGDTGFKSPTDPQRQRVITYGLNGWLISPPDDQTGSIRAKVVQNEKGGNTAPAPLRLSSVTRQADTIMFAEVATEALAAFNFALNLPTTGGTDQWNSAPASWIDISPREWVENGIGPNSYDPNKWNATSGVARDFYGGGGNYAFVDGHVQFHKIGQTVGLGKTYLSGTTQVPVTAGTVAWRDANTHNWWNPRR